MLEVFAIVALAIAGAKDTRLVALTILLKTGRFLTGAPLGVLLFGCS